MSARELQAREPEVVEKYESTRDRPTVAPRTDIHETGDNIVLYADMPGVDDAHVNITLEKNILTIEGTTLQDDRPSHALSYGEARPRDFRRSFTLSDMFDRDKINASVRDGVLKVVLPKAEPAKARRIKVSAG